jgi:hypothetical protein
VDGQGLYFATRENAIASTRKALAQGSRFTDVGCMQVDLQYHPTAFKSLEEAYDPATNADYAARFLAGLYVAAGGNWFVAAGWYHSRSPDLAHLYRAQITAVGSGRPLAMPGRLRLALPGGGVRIMLIGSLAPPSTTDCMPGCYRPWSLSAVFTSQ